uniref:glutathione S-transferase T3-like n=1 Tax=Erigeron canadensis TaxID=72917 RepID=UPI001CB8CF40|nr:glutathione S-transferase T3-like [Erigeron canadensis]
MNLCKAWLEVTEDPREPNFQKERTYWSRITDCFLKLEKKPAGYRDADVVGAKLRKMRPQIQNFNQIYIRLTNAINHQSGANEADVVKAALNEYRGTYLKTFGFLDIWEKLRYSSKFHYVVDFNAKKTRCQASAKRSKTSLDSAARKAAQAGSSGSGGKGKRKAGYQETFDNLTVKFEGLMDISKERVGMGKEKIELSKMKTKESEIKLPELNVLANDYSHLPEPNRSIMMKAQQDIRENMDICSFFMY